jgi:hypothetical protein
VIHRLTYLEIVLRDCDLTDLRFTSPRFTWSNRQEMVLIALTLSKFVWWLRALPMSINSSFYLC